MWLKSIDLTIYTFEELGEEARWNAAQNEIDTWLSNSMGGFGEIAEREARDSLGSWSDPEVQYDFSCSQGSGLNVYGEFDLDELANLAGVTLPHYIDGDIRVKCEPNRWYTYSRWCREYYGADIETALQEEGVFDSPNCDPALVEGLILKICSAMDDLCGRIYAIGEDEIERFLEPGHWSNDETLYLEDGTFYGFVWDVDSSFVEVESAA